MKLKSSLRKNKKNMKAKKIDAKKLRNRLYKAFEKLNPKTTISEVDIIGHGI